MWLRLIVRAEESAGGVPFRVESPTAAAALTDAESIAELDRPWWGNGDVHTARTADFLRWRYAAHPHYTYFAEVERDGGEVVATAIFRVRMRRRLREVMLDDLLVRDHRPEVSRRILERLRRNVAARLHRRALSARIPTVANIKGIRIPHGAEETHRFGGTRHRRSVGPGSGAIPGPSHLPTLKDCKARKPKPFTDSYENGRHCD